MAAKEGLPDKLPLTQLLLDDQNPRLASTLTTHPAQEELVRILWEDMAVDEVALSIAANGFYAHEPLIVIRKSQKYVVVEGNRRLAAVLLLTDANLRKRVGATDLPPISQKLAKDLQTLPVSIHGSRQDLWAYLGFRHINGTKPWDSFSKAQYVARLREQYKIPLKEIARRIGDRHSTVLRFYNGYVVLQQAEKSAAFDRADRVRNRFFFSHLYTAVDQPEFRRFIGLRGGEELKSSPVPRTKLRELRDLMVWLYGSQSRNIPPTIRSQNPDLNYLREVVGNPSSLASLRRGSSLQRAYEMSIGDDRRFREALTLAKEELQDVKATVTTGYKGERDLQELMGDVSLLVESIQTDMKSVAQRRLARPRTR